MELVIVQQNVCGRDVYEGKRNIQDYEILIKEVREENPDIIFLTEFYYREMYDITQEILEEYEFIKPVLLSEEDENKDGLYASCILAIKKTTVNKPFSAIILHSSALHPSVPGRFCGILAPPPLHTFRFQEETS